MRVTIITREGTAEMAVNGKVTARGSIRGGLPVFLLIRGLLDIY